MSKKKEQGTMNLRELTDKMFTELGWKGRWVDKSGQAGAIIYNRPNKTKEDKNKMASR